MSTLEDFLEESNFHELHALADLFDIAIRENNKQKIKTKLAKELDAKITTSPNKKEIIKDYIRKGRIEAMAFIADEKPNLINGLFEEKLPEYFDIVEHDSYTMYEPNDFFKIPNSLWFCKLKNTEKDRHEFIVFKKFLKKETLKIAQINKELLEKFGFCISKPLIKINIQEVFKKLQNENLEYIHKDFKVFYSAHKAINKAITSSTHLSSGNEKVTKDIFVNDGANDDLDINYFIKHGNVIKDMDLLDYMVIKATDPIIKNLTEIKINIVREIKKKSYERYKLLITEEPNILHTYNIDTTIDDILLIINYLNDIK